MPRPLHLPLPPPVEPPPAAAADARLPGKPRLWAAIHLPALPLEALGEPADSIAPIAVVENEAPRATIVALSAGARRAGIKPGMAAGAACARAGNLVLRQREPAREAAVIDRLASWGERFTSVVSTEPPAALLLDVGASLTLFGGAEALRERIRVELGVQGYEAHLALAPTPRAALWLARMNADELLTSTGELPGSLGALPLAALRLPARTARNFDRLGVRTLTEAFRLPQDGLARRFGPELLRDWDRALGRLPEARRQWRAESRFSAERELPAPLDKLDRIEVFIDCLLAELVATLRRHDAGIHSLTLAFKHVDGPATRFVLRLLSVSREPAHFKRLVHTRLESVVLRAPAVAIQLDSSAFQAVASHTEVLLDEPASPPAELDALIETLHARLGHDAVFSLAPTADPRPEHAWRRVAPGAKVENENASSRRRPIWLLRAPRRLSGPDGLPRYRGRSLALLDGPERIEGGWWDDRDIGRDYYAARTGDGARLWIYREHRGARCWFLHGYFA